MSLDGHFPEMPRVRYRRNIGTDIGFLEPDVADDDVEDVDEGAEGAESAEVDGDDVDVPDPDGRTLVMEVYAVNHDGSDAGVPPLLLAVDLDPQGLAALRDELADMDIAGGDDEVPDETAQTVKVDTPATADKPKRGRRGRGAKS